jgi:two-component system KDP operon response regulator KdpE
VAGDLVIDLDRRLVSRAGEAVRLTPKEYDVLAQLARAAGKVLTHRELLTSVWGAAHASDTQYLRVVVGQLRQKLEPEPAQPVRLLTEPGVGYRLQA